MKTPDRDLAEIGGEPIDTGGLPIRIATAFAGPWSTEEGKRRLSEELAFRLGPRNINQQLNDAFIQADFDRLAENVDSFVKPIEEYGSEIFVKHFRAAALLLRQGDEQGLTDLLRCFGGMSSVNDAFYPDEDERRLSLIYELALALKGEQARLKAVEET